ncbi:MAG: M48 family metallopeptidase [Bacteroidales bacterium]|nr:M48 family metallopeptidase [Bacteroidales bacterium]
MAVTLFFVIIFLVITGFIVDQLISWLNHRSRFSDIPKLLAGVYTPERYGHYLDYKSVSYRFGLLLSWLSFAATLFMLFAGFVMVDDFVISVTDSPVLQALLFFGTIGLAADLLSTPFDVYDTFVIEQKFGFNKSTPAIYIGDKLKSWLLAAVIGGGLLSLIVWLYGQLGSSFWWLAWVAITVFSLFFSLFYSNLIVPLFNKQTPLEPGELRDKLNNLAERTGFSLTNIFVIDGSKRSTRANAYFTGFGSRRRIVLFDTLIGKQSSDQITAILAHEVGHYRKKHTIKTLIMSVIQSGIILYLFSVIVGNPVIYQAMGSSGQGFHLGLIVFFILYSPVSSVTSVLMNYISRRFEYQADRFAAENADPEAMISALKLITSDNLSDLTPHPWHVFLNYSHPPLKERIENILNERD